MRVTGFPVVLGFALGFAAASSAAGEEAVRTIQAELPAQDLARFSVENLVGTMRISAGTGSSVTVVATVHAESQDLADAVRLERSGGSGGVALRVRYPYDKVSTFRYREPGNGEDYGFGNWASSSTYHYDGHQVRVSPGRGTRLYADLEVHVPAGRLNAGFRNLSGLVDAEGLQGELRFSVSSADLRLRRLDGTISLEGSSGDIRARDIKGSWTSDFSSGDCEITGFEGDALSLHTTSGDLALRSVHARRAEFQTTSGDVRLSNADLEELSVDATSGDVAFESSGKRLRDVRIRTSSGDVALRLPADAAFDVDADQSSGDMEVDGFPDGTSVRHRDSIVGYRHGSGGAHIRVRTSSGDLTLSAV